MSTKKPATIYCAAGFERNQKGWGEFGRIVILKPANPEVRRRLVN